MQGVGIANGSRGERRNFAYDSCESRGKRIVKFMGLHLQGTVVYNIKTCESKNRSDGRSLFIISASLVDILILRGGGSAHNPPAERVRV